MKNLLIFVLFSTFFSPFSFSQSHPGWTNYTYNHNVTGIEIEGNNLWISTQGGLIKYNKKTGEKSFYNRANANLPDNDLVGVCSRDDNTIWVSTSYYGIGKIEDGKCTAYNMYNSGLPFNQHNRFIKKDNTGNIWVASYKWMVCFDGTTWKTWETGSPVSSFSAISGFDIDSSGLVWVYSTDGIGKIENDIYSLVSDIGSSLNTKIGCVKIDKGQNVWIAIEKQGLYKYDGLKFTHYPDTISCLQNKIVFDITFDAQNKMWLGTSGGLVEFSDTSCRVYPAPQPILTLKAESNNDTIWCGGLGGRLFCFNGIDFREIEIYNSPLTDNIIAQLFVDNNNNKWISTRKNTSVKTNDSFYEVYDTISSAFASDKDGTTWIAFNSGKNRLLKISQGDTTVFNSTNSPFEQSIQINSMVVDEKNILWISTNNGIYTYNGESFNNFNTINSAIPSNYIGLIIFDHKGNLWGALNAPAPGNPNGLFRFDGTDWVIWNTTNSEIPTNIVIGMDVDSENKIWFSCMDETRKVGRDFGGGLSSFDGESITTYNIDNSGLLSNSIFDIYVDKNDKIWLATSNAGLMSFDKKDNWKSFDVTNSGIAHNWVQYIKQDKDGNLWLGHRNAGISVYQADTLTSSFRIEKADEHMQIFPNPANSVLQVKFPFPDSGNLNAKVYDLKGRLIHHFTKSDLAIENPFVTILLPDLSQNNQLYILQIDCEAKVYTKKFLYRK